MRIDEKNFVSFFICHCCALMMIYDSRYRSAVVCDYQSLRKFVTIRLLNDIRYALTIKYAEDFFARVMLN